MKEVKKSQSLVSQICNWHLICALLLLGLSTVLGQDLDDIVVKIPSSCFMYSTPVGDVSIGDQVDNKNQVLSSEFKPDMRLHSVRACINNDQLNGLTFMLYETDTASTRVLQPAEEEAAPEEGGAEVEEGEDVAQEVDSIPEDGEPEVEPEEKVPLFELETLGYRYGSNCQDVQLPANSFVNYFEVSYDQMTLQIKSAFLNFESVDKAATGEVTASGNWALFGKKSKEDVVKDWFFSPEKQLIGLRGTETATGIASLGVIVYEPACAARSIERAKRLASRITSGSSFQNEDGTLDLSSETDFNFSNPAVTSQVTKTDESIWSFDNPTLVSDVANWSLETP